MVRAARWGLAVVSLLLLASCSSVQRRMPTGFAAPRFFQVQRDRMKSFQQISAKLSLRYDGPKESVSGKGRFISASVDQHRLELRDPLGRVQFLIAQNQKDFQAQYPRQGIAYLDDQGGKSYLKKYAGIALDFRALTQLAVGVLPSAWSKNSFDTWEWDDAAGLYRGTAKVGQLSIECAIDGSNGALLSVHVKNPGTIVEVRYSDLDSCCEGFAIQQTLAKVAEIRWPRARTAFEFEWQDVQTLKQQVKAEVFSPALDEKWKVNRL